MDTAGIISKDRVKDFGEVFTPDKIVNDMLDLVDEQFKDMTDEEYITRTYLEPACGDGQFLVRILYRKLKHVMNLPVEKHQLALIKALSSIYAVDIQEDNVKNSRKRLKALILGQEITTFGKEEAAETIKITDLGIDLLKLDKVIDYILSHNIIIGNTLEPTTLQLVSYHWEKGAEDELTIATACLENLKSEYDETKIMNYMELGSLYKEESINVGDIAHRYDFARPWGVESKTTEKKAVTKKKSDPSQYKLNFSL